MRRTQKLTLQNEGSDDSVKRGTVRLQKGQAMLGYRCKIGFPLKNTGGAPITPASGDVEKALSAVQCDLAVGPEGHSRTPYHNLGLDTVRTLERGLFWQKADLETDAVNGFGTAVANGTTATRYLHVIIPTFQLMQIPELVNVMAMGRSQAMLAELKLTRIAPAPALATANLSIDSAQAITVEVYPEIVPVKVDRWIFLPEYNETHLRKQAETYGDMFWILLAERTAIHDNTTLTKVNIAIEGQEIQRDVSPADMIQPLKGFPNLPAAAQIWDKWTLLHWIPPGSLLRNIPTGHLSLEQPNNDMADMQLSLFGIPVPQIDDLVATLKEIAKNVRGENVHAVSTFAAEAFDFEDHLSAFSPINLYGPGEAGYEKFAGLRCPKDGEPTVLVPGDVTRKVSAVVKGHKDAKKDAAARDTVNKLARYVPGAASTGTGFDKGGRIYDQVRLAVGG